MTSTTSTSISLEQFESARNSESIQQERLPATSSDENLDAFQSSNTATADFTLPPADGGYQAWAFLLGSFLVEGLVWGFPNAFGVFQNYFSTNKLFGDSAGLAVIGTTQTGVLYLASPFVLAIHERWPRTRRLSTVVGLMTSGFALLLASYATTKWHLVLTQGVLYGFGGLLSYSPAILWVDEWFIQRRSTAFGVMWAGTGVAGAICPTILAIGMEKYGFRIMLRAWAVGLIVLSIPLYWLIRPRLPIARAARLRRFDFSFVKDPAFIIFEIGNVVQGLGYFLPTLSLPLKIYLPAYAMGLVKNQNVSPALTTSLPLVLVNVSSVFGCIAMGAFTERFKVAKCVFAAALGSTLAVLAIWATSTSLAQLYIFCILYGMSAGSFSTTWSGISAAIAQRQTSAFPSMVFGLLAAGRGIGSIASGPLSGLLLKVGEHWDGKGGYGTGFGGVLVFVGVTALVGGISFPAMLAGWL